MILMEPDEVDAGGCATVRDARAAHLRRVLKVEPGRSVRAGLLNGNIGTATVTDVGPDGVTLVFTLTEPPPPRPGVDLLLAMPRPKVLNRLWPQLAALGVDRIALTGADKVEPSYFDSHVLLPESVRRHLIEGLQQAGDTRLPETAVYRRLEDCLDGEARLRGTEVLRIAADPRFDGALDDRLADRKGRRLGLAIGPEGGWSDSELKMLTGCGYSGVTLGPRILRADTACVAMVSFCAVFRSPVGRARS